MKFPTDVETRKLTAIMFTDIKGFSKKMAKNETNAFELLKTHDALLHVLAAKFDGRVIKSIGDSFMIDFASAVNAVRCAIEAQKRFSHFNKKKSELDKIEIRVGIHLGDVIIRDEDIIGDGVNIASRIEAMAGPNRIWISQDVYQQVRNKIQLRVFPLGPQQLKNIPEHVEVYEILIDGIDEFATPSARALETLAHNQEELAQKVETEEALEARHVEEAKQRAKQGFEKREEEQKEEIAEHYANAEKYYEEGKTDEAEAELNKIYQLDPQQRINTERRKAAKEQEIIMQEYLQKANEFFAGGQLDAAESEVNEIFRLQPLHVGAQQLLAQIEEERYRVEEKKRTKRLENAPKQISQEERHIEELLEQARALLQEEKFTEATFTLHELFVIDPNHSDARRLEESIRQTEQAKAELLRIQAKQAQEEQRAHELAKLQQKVEEQKRQQAYLHQQIDHKARHKKLYYIAAAILTLGVALFGIPKLLDLVFPKKASIAILQCMNAPHDTSNIEVFDALPVLLAEDFSRCEHLTVIAPSSSLLYIPDQAHIQKIASMLPTSYLVMITVQEYRGGYTLLIRLLNPDQQKIISVGSVEGQISALSEMRTNILQKVIEKMEIKSKLPEIAQISNVDAFEKYLKAIHLLQLNSGTEIDSAKTLLLTAVQIDPSFGLGYALLADINLRMFFATNDPQFLKFASEYAQRALQCSPNIALAHRVLAICARLQQNYNTALSSIAQSVALLPQDPECYRELAFLSIVAGKFDDASMYASNALLHDPVNAKSHFTIALTQQMKQEYSAAQISYKQAQYFGEDEEALTINFIQNIWLNEGNYDRVIEYFRQKLLASPKDYRYYYWIGRAYQLSLQISTAQKWLGDGLTIAQQTIEGNSEDAIALSFVGLFHSRLGNFSDGETAMDKAIQINNNSAEILFRSAELFSIQRDIQKAFPALEKALRRKYDFAELLNPDFSFIAHEPEFLPAVTRKIEGQWPIK
ncbi:MAG: adenylate/guanylate cyclase domain-containing protein [Bacteroidota bacterium]|jgi:class 3 adenylate cyclase/TolB-like protein/Tfp pilus assembly protein PilF